MKDIVLNASSADGGTGDRKVRAKTLQEKMGFLDHDLTTPMHDQIVLWLDANAVAAATAVLGKKAAHGWEKKHVEACKSKVHALWWALLKEACKSNLHAWTGGAQYVWDGSEGWARLAGVVRGEVLEGLNILRAMEEHGASFWATVDENDQWTARWQWNKPSYGPTAVTWDADEAQRDAFREALRPFAWVATDVLSGKAPLPETLASSYRAVSDVTSLAKWQGLGAPPEVPPVKVISRTWESPVLDRSFTIGFIDVLMRVSAPELTIQERGGTNDLPEWIVVRETANIAFEVKTTIPSLGELIRQIRLYETYLKDDRYRFCVVSPEARWAEPLKGQHIDFLAYPDGLDES
jgi:hypothetical protein